MKAWIRKIFPGCFRKPYDYEGEPEEFLARGRLSCLYCNDPAHTSRQHFALVEPELATVGYLHISDATIHLHQRTSRLPGGARSHVQKTSGYRVPAAWQQSRQLRLVSGSVVRREDLHHAVGHTRTLAAPQQLSRESFMSECGIGPPDMSRVSSPVHPPENRDPATEKAKQLIPLESDDSRRQRRFDEVQARPPYPDVELMPGTNSRYATKHWHEIYDNLDEMTEAQAIPYVSPVIPLSQASRSRASIGEYKTTSQPPNTPRNLSSEPVVSDNELPHLRPTSDSSRSATPWKPQTPSKYVRPHSAYFQVPKPGHSTSLETRGIAGGAWSVAGSTIVSPPTLPHQPDANCSMRLLELPPPNSVSPEGFLVEDYDRELTGLCIAWEGS